MDNSKRLKKGEVLIKEGDPLEKIYLIKTGRLGLFIERNGKKIEIGQLGPGQIYGEKALFIKSKTPTSVIALNDSSYMDMPANQIKELLEKSDAVTKVITKGLSDALFDTRKNLQSLKMEQDAIPCAQRMIPKVCAVIFMTAGLVGKEEEDKDEKEGQVSTKIKPIIVSWNTLKLYSNRWFLEPHSRVQGFIEILTKLKYAEMVYRTNDEGLEELSDIKFLEPKLVEEFGDFYQYQYYKGSRSEVIFVDKLALKCADMIVQVSEDAEIDHRGATNLDFEKFHIDVKEKFNFEFKSNYLDVLEKKGLFASRRTRNDKVQLSFDREEFRKTVMYWKIIQEVDKWNERGFVDMNEKEESLVAPPPGSALCEGCEQPILTDHKFCPNCGAKVAA